MGPCIQTCIQHWISLVYLGNQIFINHTNSASGLSHLTALLKAYQNPLLSISEYFLLMLLTHLLMQLNISLHAQETVYFTFCTSSSNSPVFITCLRPLI